MKPTDRINSTDSSWKMYLPWGFAVAVLMSLLGPTPDAYPNALTVAVFFIMTGFQDNLKELLLFIKKHMLFSGSLLVSFVYFLLNQNTYLVSYKLPVTVFLIVFGGYAITKSGFEQTEDSIRNTEAIIFSSIIIGLIWFFAGRNDAAVYFPVAASYYQAERLVSIYVHPIPAAGIFMTGIFLGLGVIRDIRYKLVFIMAGTLALLLTSSRMAIMVFAVGAIIYLATTRAISKYAGSISIIIKEHYVILLLVLLAVIALLYWKRGAVENIFSVLIQRTSDIMDIGNIYRLNAWKALSNHFFDRPLPSVVLGSGYWGAFNVLDTDAWLISLEGAWAGVVENTFLSAAFDYGVVGLGLLVYIVISCVITFIKTKCDMERCIALALLCVLCQGLVYDIQNWSNMSFLLFALSGIHLGLKDQRNG